jgi:hypothetical protein
MYDDVAWYEGRYPSQLGEGRARGSRESASARMSARAAAAAGSDTGNWPAAHSSVCGCVTSQSLRQSLQLAGLRMCRGLATANRTSAAQDRVLAKPPRGVSRCVPAACRVLADADYAEYAAGLDDYLRTRGAAGPDPDRADRPVAAKVANRRSFLSDK